jgi:hypothetical protein
MPNGMRTESLVTRPELTHRGTTTMAPRNGVPADPRPATNGRLAVDGRAVTKRTMLTLPQGMPIGAWRTLGRQIFVITDSSAWWLGDWLIYGQSEYPDRYKKAIADTSLDYQTLRNYAWVARRFAPYRRRERLSFQHHAEVASLPEADQDLWLLRAEQHGWSRNELRRQVQGNRDGGRDKQIVHIQMNLVADQKQRWQEAAERAEQDLLAWIVGILDDAASTVLQVAPEATALDSALDSALEPAPEAGPESAADLESASPTEKHATSTSA